MNDNHMIINGERFPVINAWVEVESPSDGRRRWGIVTDPAPEAEVQPAAPAGATARHPLMGVPLPDGIPEDVHLSVTTPAGPVLQHTLIAAALVARTSGGGLLPFLYRDPYDPEMPDAQRPLRRATLAIIDDRIADVQPAAASKAAAPDDATVSNCMKRADVHAPHDWETHSASFWCLGESAYTFIRDPRRCAICGGSPHVPQEGDHSYHRFVESRPVSSEAELADRMFGPGTAARLQAVGGLLSSLCGEPLGGSVICALSPGHDGDHGKKPEESDD